MAASVTLFLTLLVSFSALSPCFSHATAREDEQHPNHPLHHPQLSVADETRAKCPFPPKMSAVLAPPGSTSVAATLNEWLRQNVPQDKLKSCESFSSVDEHHKLADLNDILSKFLQAAHPGLQDIYLSKCAEGMGGCDKRAMRLESLAAYQDDWLSEFAHLRDLVESTHASDETTAIHDIIRNGKCYEAVQMFYHHLSEESRLAFLQEQDFVMPLLPKHRDEPVKVLSQMYTDGESAKEAHRQLQFERDPFHGHSWDNRTYEGRKRCYEEGVSAFFDDETLLLLEKFNIQSPCEMAHRKLSEPWSVASAVKAGVSPEVAQSIADQIRNDTFNTNGINDPIPDTSVPGSGYHDCNKPETCLAGGDQQFAFQAVVRAYTVPGSGKILIPNTTTPFGQDLIFHTRTFEAIPGASPSAWGPKKAGGDGTDGLLGPAIVANPGDKVYVFVKNNLGDTSYLGPEVPDAEDFWKRIQIITNATGRTNVSLGFAPNVPYNGPQWRQHEYPLKDSDPVPAANMTAAAGIDNVPGNLTDGYDIFNIHMHGWEVAPHLFYPPGTSQPDAEWISISPGEESERQCMCYHFELAEDQSRGDFLYHTHRHGTTTMLTWSGMFGLSLTGEANVTDVRENPDGYNKTLAQDLVRIADAEGLDFTEDDVHFVVIYDTTWNYVNETENTNQTQVVVSDFIAGVRSTSTLQPFFVNNEYQPTITARTGALTVFRIACVSAGKICAFMILEGDGWAADSKILPFDRVASDGISYLRPVHREGNGNPSCPDATYTEAYLEMGGGMREVVVVQFPKAGNYSIWQISNAFDDAKDQLLMTVIVSGPDAEVKSIDQYDLTSARPHIPPERKVEEYRGFTFGTQYNQEVLPFPYYGVGNINGEQTTAYNLTTFDVGAQGGTCGIWIIRTMDVMLHPFHIHVNPFMVLNSSAHWEDNPELKIFTQDYTPPFDTMTGTALNGIWRDTALVPPYGYLVIKQCYDAGVRPHLGAEVETFGGKFVFHCHFLVHEDTGLIRNVILASNTTSNATTSPTTPTTASPSTSPAEPTTPKTPMTTSPSTSPAAGTKSPTTPTIANPPAETTTPTVSNASETTTPTVANASSSPVQSPTSAPVIGTSPTTSGGTSMNAGVMKLHLVAAILALAALFAME